MNFKEFIISFLWVASFDSLIGFSLFLLWKFLDLKYFSTFDIETLRRENEYLKEENRKVNGSNVFWDKGDIKK